MKYITYILSLTAAAVLLSSCGTCQNSADVASIAESSEWIPVFVAGAENAPKPKSDVDEKPFIRFDGKGRMNGMSGNNLFGGDYSISKDGEFKTDKVYSTRRMGPFFKYESAFLQAVNEGKTLRVSDCGKYLELCSGDGDVLLRFQKSDTKNK